MNLSPPPTHATPTRHGDRHGDSEGSTGSSRWKASASGQQISGAFRSVLLKEQRRREGELAAKDLNETLKQETLDALRQKALDLQNDKWMYEDVHI